MNRRFFLQLAAGMAFDPERLLWRPGAKLISIPKPTNPKAVEVLYKVNGQWYRERALVGIEGILAIREVNHISWR